MDLFDILFKAHSGIRWLVVAAGAITLIKLAITWFSSSEWSRGDNILTKIFVGMLDLQFLLGLSLIVSIWLEADTLARHQIEHGVTNLIAIIVAHVAARWKKSPGPIRARNTLIAYLITAILIVVAISRLPQGWAMSGT